MSEFEPRDPGADEDPDTAALDPDPPAPRNANELAGGRGREAKFRPTRYTLDQLGKMQPAFPTDGELDPAEVATRWQAWLVERNRRGTIIAFWLTIVIYPAFALLDVLMVDRSLWPVVFAARGLVVAWTLWLGFTSRRPLFVRGWLAFTCTHALMLSFGISTMVAFVGGFRTPYYAGINLTMVGVGLLFIWPLRAAVVTYSLAIASYVIPSAASATVEDWAAGAPHLFFLVATATVVTAAHGFAYRAAYRRLVDQMTIEKTKANLEQANDKLKTLDKFKSQFFANITHELKTPLAMVLAPLELLIDGELGAVTDEQRGTLKSMLRSGMKLLKLIGDLLDLSKLEESRIRLRIQQADLTE